VRGGGKEYLSRRLCFFCVFMIMCMFLVFCFLGGGGVGGGGGGGLKRPRVRLTTHLRLVPILSIVKVQMTLFLSTS